jgi:NADPH:quinone reductase-like Zn-dependent oxidoreductase
MKAAVFDSFGSAEVLRVADIERPAIAADEILVRVRAAAVNPKDVFIRKGRFAQWTGNDFPMQTGFDFAGQAAAVGGNVADIQKGQAVYGMIDGWAGRTCAEYIAVKPHQLSRRPGNLSFEEAAALPLASLTALQALRDEAAIADGFRVCINGASGGVGSMAVQIARLLGASVTAVSRVENHAFLKELGADECIDYQRTDVTTLGRNFDIFFDVFGNRLFETVQPVLTDTGIWVSTVLRPEVMAAVEQTKNSAGQTAKLVIVRADRDDLDQVRRWAEAGQIRPVIHDTFPLSQIGAAHRQQETKHTRGKLVVTI